MLIDFKANVAVVCAHRNFRVWQLIGSFLVFDQAYEGFSAIHSTERFPKVFVGYGLLGERVNGCKDPADHVDGMRRK